MNKLQGSFKNQMFILKRCWFYSKNFHKSIFFITFLHIFSALTEGVSITLLIPLLQAFGDKTFFEGIIFFGIIDQYFEKYDVSKKMQIFAIIIFVLVIMRSTLSFLIPILSTSLSLKLSKELNENALKSFFDISMESWMELKAGDVGNIMSNYGSRIALIINQYTQIFANLLIIIIYLVLMIFISLKFTVLFLFIVLTISFTVYKISFPIFKKIGINISKINKKLGQINHEIVYCMKLIRLSVAENNFFKKKKELLQDQYKKEIENAALSMIISPFFQLLSGLGIACFLFFIFGSDEINAAELLGSIIMYLYISGKLITPISNLNNQYASTLAHHNAIENLDNYYEMARNNIQKLGYKKTLKSSQIIKFKDVSFKYKNSNVNVLNQINFSIPTNKLTAIVGVSGTGKTTIINLITRLLEPQLGKVYIGNELLNNIQLHKWRRQCKVITQEIILLNVSLRENMCFGYTKNITDKEIIYALKLAGAYNFVKKLPNGLDTNLGPNGLRLSGGQQQRISIARAMIDKPNYIIFDEATSNLDTVNEEAIISTLQALKKNTTIIVIAHRLSVIKNADKIIYIDKGKVMSEGKHEKLIKNKNDYIKLFKSHT